MNSLAVPLLFLLWLFASLSSSVDGFLAASSSIIDDRTWMHVPESTIALPSSRANDGDGTTNFSPTQPDSDIDANELLSQAYESLTVKQLREILRQNSAKVSGNKRELVDRLGEILESKQNEIIQNSTQRTELSNGGKRKLLDSYNHMTLKELKDLLREDGAKVSGNKRELVHRLMNLRYKNHEQSQSLPDHNNSMSQIMVDAYTEGWAVLEPSTIYVQDADATNAGPEKSTAKDKVDDIHTELPILSGLIFVNKPSGYSTLPTKQQLDNPACPDYPCLSGCVKKWLYNHPEGQQRLKQAQEDEEMWWDFILQRLTNKKQQKKLKKMKDKQKDKMETFEPRPVHRLDIDTSGIVCIALTPLALRTANMLFEKKSRRSFEDSQITNTVTFEDNGELEPVQKRYVALVEGTLDGEQAPTAGFIKHSIGKVWIDDHNEWACDISGNATKAFIRSGQISTFVPDSLRDAVTSYQALNITSITTDSDVKNVTQVELTPHTGRGHQLRLHMASIGYPIVNDDMHGESAVSNLSPKTNGCRLCLHASNLSLDVWSLRTGTRDDFQICKVHVESCPPFGL